MERVQTRHAVMRRWSTNAIRLLPNKAGKKGSGPEVHEYRSSSEQEIISLKHELKPAARMESPCPFLCLVTGRAARPDPSR